MSLVVQIGLRRNPDLLLHNNWIVATATAARFHIGFADMSLRRNPDLLLHNKTRLSR